MIYDGDYFVGSALNGDSLSHHGVPKQRWGVRNGPPYPLQRGREVHYNLSKMTGKTREALEKAGKVGKSKVASAGQKISSSFKNWKEGKKADLAVKPTNNALMKNWQKKQLRISEMSNQELQQRIDRKKLEETYKHALRGDFSDPKTWNKSSKDAGNSKQGHNGKAAADGILAKIGTAAVDGLAKGLTEKISNSMTAKSKAKIARREARRDAIAKVMIDAAKERAEYKAERRNEAWKDRQEQKRQRRESSRYDDGAMEAIVAPRRMEPLALPASPSYNYSQPNGWYIVR